MTRIIPLFILLSAQIAQANPIVSFFFKQYPADSQRAHHLAQKLKNPKTLSKGAIQNILTPNPIAGIFSTYYGFLQASNANGQTMFPRKQSNTKIALVISNKVTPIIRFANTISHWQLEPGVDAQLYNAEQVEDEQSKLRYWNIQKGELPTDNILPATETLIILAKPKNIYIPTGVTLAKKDPNLLLPDMYVRKTIQSLRNAMYIVNLAPFFRPVDILYKQGKKFYGTLVDE